MGVQEFLSAGLVSLNESPSQKEGKSPIARPPLDSVTPPSMKVPPKRKGNANFSARPFRLKFPSMKVPPKRKGNLHLPGEGYLPYRSLNESPSEKEGKSDLVDSVVRYYMLPQ